MLKIADVVTQNLTVDDGLASVPTLLTIGNRLKDIDVGKVAFVAVPTTPAVADPNRLQIAEPAGSQLFAALRKDVDLTDPTAPSHAVALEAPAPAPAPDRNRSATLPPYDKALQPVTVANGSGVPGRTQEIMQALVAGGFTQAGQLDGPARSGRPAVYYGAGLSRTWPPTSPRCWGFPPRRCSRRPASPGVQVYLGTRLHVGGTTGADAGRSCPTDIVNQTAGDAVCQQANPVADHP